MPLRHPASLWAISALLMPLRLDRAIGAARAAMDRARVCDGPGGSKLLAMLWAFASTGDEFGFFCVWRHARVIVQGIRPWRIQDFDKRGWYQL